MRLPEWDIGRHLQPSETVSVAGENEADPQAEVESRVEGVKKTDNPKLIWVPGSSCASLVCQAT